jgi:L-asparaginase / beta-aspartyl-peptidase
MPRPGFLLLNHCARAGRDAGLEALRNGGHPLDAVEVALRAAESDRTERTVGCGGRPNLIGQVELDAGLMDGRTRRTGAVAAIQGFLHPVSVARQVMERLPHVLLVGDGAARFAREIGTEPAWLLTGESEQEWQAWLIENLTAQDWTRFPNVPLADITWRSAIPESQREGAFPAPPADPEVREEGPDTPDAGTSPKTAGSGFSEGTSSLRLPPGDSAPASPRDTAIALAGRGDELASAASTSGWAYKYPGRVGDSALPGCGHYADARFGAAACTHTGEMSIRAGTARSVVLHLANALSVDEACRAAIADLRRLEGGFLDELVIHAVDVGGNHCVATTGIGALYWWWCEGMDEPVQRAAPAM